MLQAGDAESELSHEAAAFPAATGALADVMGLGEIAAASIRGIESAEELQADVHSTALAEARERGYQDGLSAGQHAGKEEWRLRVERLLSVIEGIERTKAESESRLAEEAVAIAFESVVKILGRRQASHQAIAEVVEQTRRASSGAEPMVVRVSPDDYEALLVEPVLIELEDQRGAIRLVEDPRVMLGGCIVESSRGTLDARLETQIERLKSVLLDVQKADVDSSDRQP